MTLSFLLSSLPSPFESAVREAVALGFTHIDVVALGERPSAHLDVLAESGLLVGCAAIGKGMPEEITLDAVSLEHRRAALEETKKHIADAARLGATHAYLVPGLATSKEALAAFTEACRLLADWAAQRMVRLCVEHVPGRALPSVAATLDWLNDAGHDNLYLLIDLGHCLISDEDPAAAVRQAGQRLGWVHLDDNDARQDLHWPLLTGKLTRETLRSFLEALRQEHYRGALTLELNPANPEPIEALREGKALVESVNQ